MSMSQEEIESLMNGLDLAEDSASEVASEGEEAPSAPAPVEEVPAAVEETAPEPEIEEPVAMEETPVDDMLASVEETVSNEELSNDSIDDLINNLDLPEESNDESPDDATVSTDDIDELLASIDTPAKDDSAEVSDIDDLLAGLDEVKEETMASSVAEPVVVPEVTPEPEPVIPTPVVEEKKPLNEVEDKIEKGVFPYPADPESKVVSQLSAVANDSEEKATKIFDVLSYILDENYNIESSVKKLDEFLEAQEKVLQTLTAKFPNVDVFANNLTMLNELKDEPKKIKEIVNKENNELFSAMELMQYHDINRQKIERVMSVIRKLTVYLNNIFEDDNSHEEIAVAKHISGDSTSDLVEDEDLDALIAEFGN